MQSKCKCGAVTIEVKTNVHQSINCHCNMCRQNHGSAFTTWISVNASETSIAPKSPISEYRVSDNCCSYFCSICGTKVYATDKRYPDVIAFLAGTVFGTEIKPATGEYFYSDKAPWNDTKTNSPIFGGPNGFEKLKRS